MKQLRHLVLICALAAASAAPSPCQRSTRKTRKSAAAICATSLVPKGAVIVGYKSNATCASGNELVVKKPEDGDIVCEGSPVPPNFSIATKVQGDLIGTCQHGAFLIQSSASAVAETTKPKPLPQAELEAHCDAEVKKEIARYVANGYGEQLAASLAAATRTICLKQGKEK